MAEEWKVTHHGENGEELFCEDGKYYTRHAWDHFGDAYRGAVKPPRRSAVIYLNRTTTPADFAVDPDGNTWDLSDVDWGTDDETTLEMPALPAKP